MLTAERVQQGEVSDNYLFQRQLLAYVKAAEMISGNVLELGTGGGYGLKELAVKANHLITMDRYAAPGIVSTYHNVEYRKINFPPFYDIADESMDFVVSFLVIEHIKKDGFFLEEVKRVLKKGGKAIITTPNWKMTLVRNPWHIREYTKDEYHTLFSNYFSSTKMYGITGNKKVMDYYEKNAKSVNRILKFDIFNLHKNAPSFLLKIPFDIANRLNKWKLLSKNYDLTTGITMEDYYFHEATDDSFDLFMVAEK